MPAQEKEVLVTGGSGFLGGWCVIELLRRGYRVRTTVRDLGRETALRAEISSQVDAEDRLELFAANLLADAGWSEAAAGCGQILHVASPFPAVQPKDADELILPAREGTLRVLRAGLDAGVDRIVVTSSVAAVGGSATASPEPLNEEDWTDLADAKLSPYARSKTLAERAAWDLMGKRSALERIAVVNPGAILGPVLSAERSPSLDIVQRLLNGLPGAPRIGFNLVDVRDVADLQIKAMLAPEAGGKRLIAVSGFHWMAEVAKVLREGLGPTAAKVPRRSIPDILVRTLGIFDPSVRSVVGQLGRKVEYSSERAEGLLAWKPRPIEETIVDCARSMTEDAEGATSPLDSGPRAGAESGGE